MTSITINDHGLSDALKNWANLTGFKRGMLVAGAYVKAQAAAYPPVSHRPQPFVSDRQRRGFFAKLKSGEIDVPYVRGSSPGSQKQGRQWRIDKEDGGRSVVIGNPVTYAGLTQGTPDKQALYHMATGWRGVDEIGEATGDEVHNIVLREMTAEFE